MPQPRLTYRVSCVATLLHYVEFEVEADSAQQAIDFCAKRLDADGKHIEPIDDHLLETESEDGWSATPIG